MPTSTTGPCAPIGIKKLKWQCDIIILNGKGFLSFWCTSVSFFLLFLTGQSVKKSIYIYIIILIKKSIYICNTN